MVITEERMKVMKKTISLILVLIMCLSLCACGKSEEVKAAEELIATIGEITLDNTDAINNARDAFSALSDEEKEKVENAEVLYDSMFTSIALRCKAMNTGSDLVADSVIEVWGNVGGEGFWTWYDTILKFKDESRADIDYSEDFLVFNMPAYALGMIDSSFEDLSEEQVEEIGTACVNLAKTYFGIIGLDEAVKQDIIVFKDLFGDTHTDECEFLREWYLASSTFVEFATNPSGNRNDYTSDLAEYNSNVLKFQKEADLMN